MSASTDMRTQLRSLSIPREQRPAASPTTSARRDPPANTDRPPRPRWPIALVLLVPFALLVYWLAPGLIGAASSATAKAVRLLTVTAVDPNQPAVVLTATGKIVSDHKVLVSTKVSGQIVDLRFEQGDIVNQGQVLARIEDVLYRAMRDQAAAELDKSRANLAYQKTNFARIQRLHEGANAPEIEFADARRWLEDAQAQVAANEASLQAAQKALTDCEVLAPISGVILERNVEVGDFVAAEGGRGMMANSQFASIADMNALRVEVDVSELDINRLRQAMPCAITPDAYKDRHYSGQILWIDPGANYSKATVQVKVRINNPTQHLRVEGSAQVQFLSVPESPAGPQPRSVSASATNASREPASSSSNLWIPPSAALREPNSKSATVFIAENGRLRAAQVTIGREEPNRLEILSGLSSGQSIAAENLADLRDGQRLPD